MDNILSRIGLYDIFGVFVSGLIAVVFWAFLRFPYNFNIMENNTENTICFLAVSYLVGLILQETGSLVSAKFTKFEKKAKTKFLNDPKVLENKHQLENVKKIAYQVFNVTNKTFNDDDNQYLYMYCLNYLESREKDGKVKRINALYAMSRSLSCFMVICLVAYFYFYWNYLNNIYFWYGVIVMCLMAALFIRRTQKFAMYKVRVVFENYIAIKEKG